MGNTVDSLKALYVAFGGDADDVAELTLIPDVISALASFIGEGGASGLPSVTADDNGKILTVVEGKWEAGEAELPAVTVSDNGKVLTVAEGKWEAVLPTP